MADEQISPGATAHIDQLQAQLRDLVEATRRHMAHCPHPSAGACVGVEAAEEMESLACGDAVVLLGMAVAQLARIPTDGAS